MPEIFQSGYFLSVLIRMQSLQRIFLIQVHSVQERMLTGLCWELPLMVLLTEIYRKSLFPQQIRNRDVRRNHSTAVWRQESLRNLT